MLVIALITVMVVFGAFTARRRAQQVPSSFWPLLISLGVAAAATLGLVLGLGIFPATPRYVVPVGGMVIGQLDDLRRGRAQPARRGRPRAGPADRGDPGARRHLLAGGRRRWSAAACARE